MKDKREDLIQSISKIRDSRSLPKVNDIENLKIVMKMNRECRECARNVYHFGQCTGRTSTTPCLIFYPQNAITPEMSGSPTS